MMTHLLTVSSKQTVRLLGMRTTLSTYDIDARLSISILISYVPIGASTPLSVTCLYLATASPLYGNFPSTWCSAYCYSSHTSNLDKPESTIDVLDWQNVLGTKSTIHPQDKSVSVEGPLLCCQLLLLVVLALLFPWLDGGWLLMFGDCKSSVWYIPSAS